MRLRNNMRKWLYITTLDTAVQIIQERWEHLEKGRYYRVLLGPDLFGQWVVTRVWGGINQATGRITHVPCTSYEEGLALIAKIAKTRLQHGYLPCNSP